MRAAFLSLLRAVFGLETKCGDFPRKQINGAMPFTFTCHGKCAKCGHEGFTSSHHPADYAPVTCQSCGHITTVNNAIRTYKAADHGTGPYLNRE
jgi:DNA-directed RNA polymerase subunit RPC12/RpoP